MSDRTFRFDPSMNLGHIVVALSSAAAIIYAYAVLTARVDQQAVDSRRIETELKAQILQISSDRKDESKRIETSFIEKVNDQKTLIQNVSITTGANIAEIKQSLIRIEEKLDRKADKPGMGR